MGTPREKKAHVQVYIWDFTFFGKGDFFPDEKDMVALLRPLFKKWAFQLEGCPTTGRKHYQGRGSLFKKKRLPELIALVNNTDLKGMAVSESSTNSTQEELFYMLKYDTRIDGPWTDQTWVVPPYIPRQWRGLEDRLYNWQQAILDTRHVFDPRTVDVLVDTKGNIGKSAVANVARLHQGAINLPPIGDHKELTQVILDRLVAKQNRDPGLVFIDCPRSMDQQKMGAFYIAVEQIKNGFVCDCRYKYREWDFDSPRVWVFCNQAPDAAAVSRDRWRFWQIDFFNALVPFEPDEPRS